MHEWNRGFTTNPAYKRYEALAAEIDRAVRFMAAAGADFEALKTVEFYSSHEALLLDYEAAMTRIDSRTGHPYNTSAHFVWIGERTRELDGAHVDLLSRVRNPIGVKLGPTTTADDALALMDRLNPTDQPGRLTFITREGKFLRTQPAPRVRDQAESVPEAQRVIGEITLHSLTAAGRGFGVATLARGGSPETPGMAIVYFAAPGSTKFIADITPDSRWEVGFRPPPIVAFTPDGQRAATISVNQMVQKGGSFTLVQFSSDGTVVARRTFSYLGIPLSAQTIDSALKTRGGIDRNRTLDRTRIPPVHFPVTSLHLDGSGRSFLIMKESQTDRFLVEIDAGGSMVGRMQLPRRANLIAATPTHFWMTQSDEDGLTSIVRYRLLKN